MELEDNLFEDIKNINMVSKQLDLHVFEKVRNHDSVSNISDSYNNLLLSLVKNNQPKNVLHIANKLLNNKINQLLDFDSVDKSNDIEKDINSRLNQSFILLRVSNELAKKYLSKDNIYTNNQVFFEKYNDSLISKLINLSNKNIDLSTYSEKIDRLLNETSNVEFVFKQKKNNWSIGFLNIFNNSFKKSNDLYHDLYNVGNGNREILFEHLLKNNKIVINKSVYDDFILNNDELPLMKKIELSKHIIDKYIDFKEKIGVETNINQDVKNLFNYLIKEQVKFAKEIMITLGDHNKYDAKNILKEYINNDLLKHIEEDNLKDKFIHAIEDVKSFFDGGLKKNSGMKIR